MPNVLKITVENPDELLNAGAFGAGALIAVQAGTAAAQPGDFADLTGVGSTPTLALVAGTRLYTGYDLNGTSANWYRTRYKNAAGTVLSEWSASFQVGDEQAGLLCSLYDVKQELGTTATTDDETLVDLIRQVSVAIEGYCDRWFAPRPLSGDTTILFDVEGSGRELRVPKGIRSVTTLGVATSPQPDAGGSYTSVTAADVLLRPTTVDRSPGWPYTSVVLISNSGSYFAAGQNTVSVAGAFGFAAVPADIQGVCIRAVIRRYIGKGKGGAGIAIGPSGEEFLLPDMSGADRATLNFYRHRLG